MDFLAIQQSPDAAILQHTPKEEGCVTISCKGFPTCTLERDMMLQQFDGEGVVDIHYHKGEQVSTRCVNEGGCKQFKAAVGQTGNPEDRGS